ncbi:MAG: HD domain-containing protein [Patulibacter sp.]|nr:HD domain-containing protein [Patulibacter sp.]
MERSPARRRRSAAALAPDPTESRRVGAPVRSGPRLLTPPSRPERPVEVSPERLAHERLAVAARLSMQLAPLQNEAAIADLAVSELHTAFDYYLAVIQRLDGDVLHVVAAAGPLVDQVGFLAFEQSIDVGVNGRVARSGAIAFVPDTRLDPDYLGRNADSDPNSELSLPIFVDGRIWGVMNLEQLQRDAFKADDVLLAEAVVAQVGAALHRAALSAEVEATVTNTLGTLIDVLEAKDAYTAQHARDVVDLSERVARRLGLADRDLRDVHYAAILHDIGKIGVPSDILRKPGKLTDEEFEQIKTHSDIGGRLLERIPFTQSVAPLVRAIHERFDGGGYPDHLVGEAIPIGARIVGACDAFDAMISDRPYRSGMPPADAVAELHRCAGTQFDPRVVAALVAELGPMPLR